MKNLNELQELIIQWAENKGITSPECAEKQTIKLFEEAGELASAYLKGNEELLKDSIGDCFVVLVILAEQLGQNFEGAYKIDDVNFVEGLMKMFHYVYEEDMSYAMSWFISMCQHMKWDLEECANLAWNEIKDRTGVTKNGVFIKD